MRRQILFFLTAALLASSPVMAQAPVPPDLQPLPTAPPPPPMPVDDVPEPAVTIIKHGGDTVEEYRVNGQLYMMKVTPAHGTPYYLIDHNGSGNWARQDDLDIKISVPMWVIMKF
jgi:hypothetical protein